MVKSGERERGREGGKKGEGRRRIRKGEGRRRKGLERNQAGGKVVTGDTARRTGEEGGE